MKPSPMTEEDEGPPTRRGPQIAMILIIILVVGGYFIGDILAATSRLQDCVMSGRKNCVLLH